MALLLNKKLSQARQYIYSLLLILAVSTACYAFSGLTGYHTTALLLLVTVSFIAMFFDIYPVVVASVLSALIWNFFFIPPRFEFHIGKSEDILIFLMYFVMALLNAVLTSKIRQYEKNAQAREEKENVLQLYNTLLNSLSHELRTPISAIMAAADTLKDQDAKLAEEQKSGMVSEIAMASLRLNRNVENLLNMSRLESGTLKLKEDWCDINELIYSVISQLKETDTVTQQFDVQVPENTPLFYLDYGLMEQVLMNLVQNAVQYSPAHTTVTICASCIIDHLELSVEDEGPGFPRDQLDKVFDRFYRLSNARKGGIGLGLSIVKGFVECQHGSIELKNKREGGAKFTIYIPAKISYKNQISDE